MQRAFYTDVTQQFSQAKSDPALFDTIVNSPFHDKLATVRLGLGIIVLLLVNKKRGTIDRIALSDTSMAQGAQDVSIKPFREIVIPEHHPKNIIAQAIDQNEYRLTTDWKDLFVPDLPADAARFNQAGAGIGCSVVYPVQARDGGALIFSYYQESSDITDRHHRFMKRYSKLVAKALTPSRASRHPKA